MLRRLIALASLSGLLAGCASTTTSAPTPYPPDYLPTVVALTGQAAFATSFALTPTIPPTETLLPTETPIPSTPAPTLSPTPEGGFTEYAQIHFISPGPMSKVVSPINLQMLVFPGDSGIVKIDLLGEDGRPLSAKQQRISNETGSVFTTEKIPFEIRAVSEVGYIQVSTKDDKGRMEALNTMPILLFSTGSDEITRPGNMIYERVMFDGLKNEDAVFGGVLSLKGRIWPFNTQPVFFDLTLPDGKVVGNRMLVFNGVETQPFATTLPYKVSEPSMARLTVRQDDPVLKMAMYVYTLEVLLNP